jgi:HJR/Mrr/RecB family endonuclease
MRYSMHAAGIAQAPRKRNDRPPIEVLFASLPRWAVVPFIAVVAGLVALLAATLHYSPQLTVEVVGAAVVVMTFAALAALREKQRAQRRLVSTRRIDDLRSLSPDAFEELVLSAYRARGWRGFLTQTGADGGVDVVLERDGGRVFVRSVQAL